MWQIKCQVCHEIFCFMNRFSQRMTISHFSWLRNLAHLLRLSSLLYSEMLSGVSWRRKFAASTLPFSFGGWSRCPEDVGVGVEAQWGRRTRVKVCQSLAPCLGSLPRTSQGEVSPSVPQTQWVPNIFSQKPFFPPALPALPLRIPPPQLMKCFSSVVPRACMAVRLRAWQSSTPSEA